jgi:hypothetical protein
VRCLMCGRGMARLLGRFAQPAGGALSAAQSVAYIAYRALNPDSPVMPYSAAAVRSLCNACGGAGVVDDLELFSTYDEHDAEVVEANPPRRRPGRPPHPFRSRSNGLTMALDLL